MVLKRTYWRTRVVFLVVATTYRNSTLFPITGPAILKMRLIFYVLLTTEMTSHFVTPTKGRELFIKTVLNVDVLKKQHISSLRNLLTCVDDHLTYQVTLFLYDDLPPPWSMAASVHGANLPVMLQEDSRRGSINVLTLLPNGRSNMSNFATHFAFSPSSNPLGVFIILYITCPEFRRETLEDISRDFYLKLGTSRVIHVCPDSDPFVYFSKSPDPAVTQWPIIGQSVTDFCKDQIDEHTRNLQLNTGLQNLKGFRFDFIIREQHMWINRKGEIRFGGRDIEFAQLLMKYGMRWLDSTKRSDSGKLRRMDFELMLPSGRVSDMRVHQYAHIEDCTTVILQSDEYLVVRKAQRIPFGLVLLLPFDWQTWSSLGGILVLFVLAWTLVHSRRFLISSFLSSYFQIIEMLLSGCTSMIVRRDSQRIIALCAFLLHMLAGNTYTGLLLGFITTPQYFMELETIKDVVAATERLYVTNGYTDIPHVLGNLGKLKDNLIIIQNVTERDTCVQDIVTSRKAGTCMNEHMYSVISRYRKYTEEGKILLHKVKEPLLSPSYDSYLVPRNHVILSVINKLILRLWQSGLLDQWDAMLAHSLDLDGQRDATHLRGEEGFDALGINQLSGPFFLYIGGVFLAGIVFLWEQICDRKRHVKAGHVL